MATISILTVFVKIVTPIKNCQEISHAERVWKGDAVPREDILVLYLFVELEKEIIVPLLRAIS